MNFCNSAEIFRILARFSRVPLKRKFISGDIFLLSWFFRARPDFYYDRCDMTILQPKLDAGKFIYNDWSSFLTGSFCVGPTGKSGQWKISPEIPIYFFSVRDKIGPVSEKSQQGYKNSFPTQKNLKNFRWNQNNSGFKKFRRISRLRKFTTVLDQSHRK